MPDCDPPGSRQTALALAMLVIGAVLLIAAFFLSGCSAVRGQFVKPAPPLAQCNQACFDPCVGAGGDTGVRWDGSADDPKAFDLLTEDTIPALVEKLRICDRNGRGECVACLRRLEKEGVIRLE